MIKGIIFDMDGTMVDNMMVHHRAWQKKLATLGLDMPLEEVKQKVHGINEEILVRLFGERFSADERIRIAYEKEATYREIFKNELQLLHGLSGFLDSLQTAGVPMGIGTAAPPENVDFVLDNLEIRHYFQSIYHSKNVTKGKPNPEVYQKVAAGISVPVQNCVVFEDSVTGAKAAFNAGAKCVVVTTTHAAEEFDQFPHILKFINDFREISWAEIQELAIAAS